MKEQALLEHVLLPILSQPESLEFNFIEGSAVVVIELTVHDDDVALFTDDDSSLLNALQQILIVSGGKRKPSLELLNIAD